MATIITRGSVSAQALGYAAQSSAAVYIEDVFSTYLYTGNGGTQTITTGVDLSTYGGLVWIKNRSNGGGVGHALTDTVRGAGTGTTNTATKVLQSNSTGGTGGSLPASGNDYLSAFSTTGFTVVASNGGNNSTQITNRSGSTYVGWSFRKQAKFFDVVTYTGNGANRTISHNLGSVPGSIFVKRTDTTGAWAMYHRSLANTEYMVLNTTAAKATGTTYWNSTTPTSSVFSLGTATDVNANGGTYVAYLFAHDAGGFGASGSDNVISCGSLTVDGSGAATVNLGYEPQWLLIKSTASVGANGDWTLFDNMRGWPVTTSSGPQTLIPNTSAAESAWAWGTSYPTATGFYFQEDYGNQDFIYIAIRRGPMGTPTSGTSVFNPTYLYQYNINGTSSSGNGIHGYLGNVSDAYFQLYLSGSSLNALTRTRLTGSNYLVTSSTAAEVSGTANFWDNNVASGFVTTNSVSNTVSTLNLRRAPGFFDVVCYTGTGSNTTQTHNLGVVPELIIIKQRNSARNWPVYFGSASTFLNFNLNSASGSAGTTVWNSTAPTSTVFSIGTSVLVNSSGGTYVAYLFASCPGVSKVGSYTGTGTTLQIDCGFTGGARFVLIKRTDSTGDWYVWDSARGIVAGNDPYLTLNSTAAEVTTTDWVDTYSAGFELSSAAGNNANINGATYIYLSVA